MNNFIHIIKSLPIGNLDLLSVGIVIAAMLLLGFIIYLKNDKSVTNRSFFYLSIIISSWSVANYLNWFIFMGHLADDSLMLFSLRFLMFCAVWLCFILFTFLYVFPKEQIVFPKWFTSILFPCAIVISLVTLTTPFVFSTIVDADVLGGVAKVGKGLGIIPFAFFVLYLVTSGLYIFIKKIKKAKGQEKKQLELVISGIIISFSLIILLNFILPAFFDQLDFIPLGALFMLPFAAFTAYAIFKHKAFKVKNLGSSLMAFFLCSATFVEIIFAETTGQLILRSGIFMFVLLICIQFVKNIFMLETITERLEKANVDLKSLDVLKSEFISLASHQLRSPLTVIKGYASTLIDGIVGGLNEKQSEIVNHIYASAQSLASMVEEFLNVSKIEQGGMKYSFESVDVAGLVASLADEMKRTAEDKHLAFSIGGVTDGTCMIQADAVKLRQVFLNLIDNSIKYTQEGFVHVSLEKKIATKEVVITISDSGIGISEETKKKLFTKFGRGEEVRSHSGGSGLGLYLAQEVVKAHHGTIHVQSKGLHLGASFSVSLPYTV